MNEWQQADARTTAAWHLIAAMRPLGVCMAPMLDWQTTRMYPAWVSADALHAHLGTIHGARALEFGPGSCEGALTRKNKASVHTVGVGNARLVLDVRSAIAVCLASAKGRRLESSVIEQVGAAMAGQALASDGAGSTCPRPHEHRHGDGLNLLANCIHALSATPERLIPLGGHMRVADRQGRMGLQPISDEAQRALAMIQRGDIAWDAHTMAQAVLTHVTERLAAVDMRVGDFADTEKLLAPTERFHAVFDSRALAHAPHLATRTLAAAARRLLPQGLLLADGVLSAYDYHFDEQGVRQAAADTQSMGLVWWVVRSSAGTPLGVLATMNWDGPPPRHVLTPECQLTAVEC